jgi:hypothetical protein
MFNLLVFGKGAQKYDDLGAVNAYKPYNFSAPTNALSGGADLTLPLKNGETTNSQNFALKSSVLGQFMFSKKASTPIKYCNWSKINVWRRAFCPKIG